MAQPDMMNPDASHPTEVAVREGEVCVTLADGRRISNPLAWYPWLQKARSVELSTVEMRPDAIMWPMLGRVLVVKDMLLGRRPAPDDDSR